MSAPPDVSTLMAMAATLSARNARLAAAAEPGAPHIGSNTTARTDLGQFGRSGVDSGEEMDRRTRSAIENGGATRIETKGVPINRGGAESWYGVTAAIVRGM